MKICDVVQFYSPLGGGVKRYLSDKMRFFSQQNDVEHMAIVPSDRNAVTVHGVTRFYEIRSPKLIGSQSYRLLINRKKILSIIGQERPDLIEVGDPYRSAWIALEAASKHKIPIVAFYHSDFPRALGRTISRFCGYWIEQFLSHRIHRYVVDLYNRMSATVVASEHLHHVLTDCGIKRLVRIPLGTDISTFHPHPRAENLRKELGLSQDDTLLLFVGRLAREKNIRSLIGMMDILTTQSNEQGRYHLLVVGDGELRRYIEKQTTKRNHLTWFRYSESAEQLATCYTAADLFVHAGCWETFGITSLEAQACGTRVLCVHGGGLDETVQGEEPLIQAKSSSPEDLAEGIRRIQQLPSYPDSETRRHRIVESFSIHLTLERLLDLYKSLLREEPVEQFSIATLEEKKNELRHPAILAG